MNYSRVYGMARQNVLTVAQKIILRCYNVDGRKVEFANLGRIYESTIISIRDPGVLLWGGND